LNSSRSIGGAKHVAAHVGQGTQIVGALDALCHCGHAQAMREVDDVAALALKFGRTRTTVHLGAVDLQLAEGKRPHPSERRVAAAEIIDRNANVISLSWIATSRANSGSLITSSSVSSTINPGKLELRGRYLRRLPTNSGVSKIEIGMLMASFGVM
jgi:hypothetical protein